MTVCIQRLQLKNFRCFSSETFDLNAPVVVIEGLNGSGKTSLLEALHYACYLKSFRTHIPRDLIAFGKDAFFINATCNDHTITVGSSGSKRQVKVDQKSISSYKELREYYRIVTVTEDDLFLIKGGPEKRRAFLDHALLLSDVAHAELYKRYKEILDQRNALLQKYHIDKEEFLIWTRKVWTESAFIQQKRSAYLKELAQQVEELSTQHWPEGTLKLAYQTKETKEGETFEAFFDRSQSMFMREQHYRRSLFGAHLDDIAVLYQGKKARLFSSRGQQKFIVLLLKIAQVKQLLTLHEKKKVAFLLDDFMTDFDETVMQKLMRICLDLDIQLIFSSPISYGPERAFLDKNDILSLNVSI